KAISYGFVDRTEKKVEELIAFTKKFQKSPYYDDALYELGNTYVAQKKSEEAIRAYDQLVRDVPTSSFVSKALMKKALIYDNIGRSDEALTIFKRVAKDFPSTPEALQAVSAAKIIYRDQGKVNEYASWVKTLDYVEVGDTELDDETYLAAEQPYLENKQSVAQGRFENYLKQFPN